MIFINRIIYSIKLPFLFSAFLLLVVLEYIMSYVPSLVKSKIYQRTFFVGLIVIQKIFRLKIKDHNETMEVPKQYILISNHVSLLDTIILLTRFNATVVFDEFKLPLISRITKEKHICKKPGIFNHKPDCADKILARLKNGENVLIFPEGTTAKDLATRFLKGSFHLSLQTNIPILPVYLHYESAEDFEFSAPYNFYQSFLRMLKSRKTGVHLFVFNPIFPNFYKEKKEYCQKVYGIYASHQQRCKNQ